MDFKFNESIAKQSLNPVKTENKMEGSQSYCIFID